jgi:integrase
MKPRDRETAKGLLPRMEARPWADGKTVTYRYHPLGAKKPLNLGTDRLAAIRRVLELIGKSDDRRDHRAALGAVQGVDVLEELKPRTRQDYEDYSVHILRASAGCRQTAITPPHDCSLPALRALRGSYQGQSGDRVARQPNRLGDRARRGEQRTPAAASQVKRNKETPARGAAGHGGHRGSHAFAPKRDAAVKTKIGRSTIMMLAAEFAALTGARQAEFLPLAWPAFDEDEVRIERAKQRMGVKKVDRIAVSPALAALRTRLLAFQTSPMGAVFPNRAGNVYSCRRLRLMWQKLMAAALEAGEVKQRFNFHALRAFYATKHKAETGALPDMHASPTTTAKIYDRSKTGRRKAL